MKLVTASDFAGYEQTEAPEMDYRRKERERVSYNKDGNIKSVYLNEQTKVLTRYGSLPAELLTFYADGSLKRLFPRYGAISAYWSEKDEAALTQKMELRVGERVFLCRPQCLHFYEDGSLQSITIYNCDVLAVDTDYGRIETRIGVSFYEDGKLASIEPVWQTKLLLDGKLIRPYNPWADGTHADHNSLCFDRNGKIEVHRKC